MEFKQEFEKQRVELEEVISGYLPSIEGYQKVIIDAMNYSMLAGGKRIRPMLMKSCYELFGGSNDAVLHPFLAAIEMIHTYSLVHDDLPAMDDDEFRRGRKTTHIVYGEDMGILAGDALLNYAFETAMKAAEVPGEETKVIKALQILSNKAGIYGMIGGQVVDVKNSNANITLEVLNFIYRLKTSALMEAAMMIGAVLAGATQNQVNLIEQVAQSIGMAFQIQDDILDVTSSIEELGKPIHSDEKNSKTTYVTLLGIEKSKELVNQYTQEGLTLLHSLENSNEYLEHLLKYMIHRSN